jgi:4a-hydroxytetrahydrobiopterin dehydratase
MALPCLARYTQSMGLEREAAMNHHRGGKSALNQPIALREARALLAELDGWSLVGGKALRQVLVMRDFMSAVHFIDAVARAAEAEGHHPDIHLTGYRNLAIELSTHSIGGLSMNDFLLAERINGLPRELKAASRPRHEIGGASRI